MACATPAEPSAPEPAAPGPTTAPTTAPFAPRVQLFGWFNVATAPSGPPAGQPPEPLPPLFRKFKGILLGEGWRTRASIAIKQTYDDNVLLQDSTRQAHVGSAVTTVVPSLEAEWKPRGFTDGRVVLNYSPEFSTYHAAPEESFSRHPISADVRGKWDGISIESSSSITIIDGSNIAPTFTAQGGGPAIGGYQVRDRRDATIYRDGLKLQIGQEQWFVRPAFSLYEHDWHTKLSAAPGYANYVDRGDINVGADLGYRLFGKTYLTLGYRYGHQSQQAFLGNPLEYSNDYQRMLAGVEGQVAPWLKLAAAAGPDFRRFGPHVVAGFDRSQTQWYFDATATITASADDEVVLLARQYMQPTQGGRAVYNDITYSVAYKHRFDRHWSAGLGFRAYGGDCEPVVREDWIYTPSACVTYAFNEHMTADLSWSLDDAESRVSGTPGRQYHRNLITLGMKIGL